MTDTKREPELCPRCKAVEVKDADFYCDICRAEIREIEREP